MIICTLITCTHNLWHNVNMGRMLQKKKLGFYILRPTDVTSQAYLHNFDDKFQEISLGGGWNSQ